MSDTVAMAGHEVQQPGGLAENIKTKATGEKGKTVFEFTPEQRRLGQHDEVVRGLEPTASRWLNEGKYLLPIQEAWQPTDVLPNLENDDWQSNLSALRERAAGLSDGLLVALVGDTITEEALPTYQTWINRVPAVRDETGTNQNGFARWSRGWTSEEKRHGIVLENYLRLSGRVDMRTVDRTTQSLIANGFDPQIGEDPYGFFVYTAFQERATNISHRRVGTLARKEGATDLAVISARVASDEKRHEGWYTDVMSEIMNEDPEGGIMTFRDMLKKRIVMPAAFMTEGETISPGARESDLFTRFADVAQSTGVYTAEDYVGIVKHLEKTWDISSRSVSGEAAKAQDQVGRLIKVYERGVAKVMDQTTKSDTSHSFSWIYDRQVPLGTSSH